MESSAPGFSHVENLRLMLVELESSCLQVCKIPSRLGGYIRVTVSINCPWYTRLCQSYTRPRKRYPKPRTIIRRETTIVALRRMIRGDTSGVYAERILAVLRYLNE